MTADPIAAILPRITREKVEPHYTERVSAPWQKSPARPMIDWIVALDGERIGVFCGQTFQPDDRARFGGPVGFLSARRGRDGRIAAAPPWACIRRQLAAIVNEEEALRPPAGGHPMTTPQIVARVIRMRAVALRAAGSWTRSNPTRHARIRCTSLRPSAFGRAVKIESCPLTALANNGPWPAGQVIPKDGRTFGLPPGGDRILIRAADGNVGADPAVRRALLQAVGLAADEPATEVRT